MAREGEGQSSFADLGLLNYLPWNQNYHLPLTNLFMKFMTLSKRLISVTDIFSPPRPVWYLVLYPLPLQNHTLLEEHTTETILEYRHTVMDHTFTKMTKSLCLTPFTEKKTSLGTYVDGKSLVKPFKPRGPESFPTRLPKKPGEILQMDNVEDIRYHQPPAFTLDNFVYHLSELRNIPVRKVRNIFYSKHNYKKLTKLLAERYIHPTVQEEVKVMEMTPEAQNIPPSEPRIPQKQLLIEMAAMIKQHVRDLMNTEVKSVIRPLRKYSPSSLMTMFPTRRSSCMRMTRLMSPVTRPKKDRIQKFQGWIQCFTLPHLDISRELGEVNPLLLHPQKMLFLHLSWPFLML